MHTKTIAFVLALMLGLTLAGCTSVETPDGASGDAAGGTRLANGLYDHEDGSITALGVLKWVDLEGGFYAITGAPMSEGDPDANIAVIANAGEFAAELEALTGTTVQVTGTRFDGVSIRMAGPEIAIDSIVAITDTPGAAE